MNKEKYLEGFIKRAADFGIPEQDAIGFAKEAGVLDWLKSMWNPAPQPLVSNTFANPTPGIVPQGGGGLKGALPKNFSLGAPNPKFNPLGTGGLFQKGNGFPTPKPIN